jgi:serine/threonine protein phosphatase PrpC
MDLAQVLEIASCTDPGMVRSHNEDSIATDAGNGLVVLADGMGGYNAGEVASGMATAVIVNEMRQTLASTQPNQIDPRTNQPMAARLVREQVLRANSSIYQAAQTQPQYAGMGTTLVVSLFYDNRVLVAHLGDSRLYLLREGELRQVTRDHSLLQEQIDSGLLTVEQAKNAQHKNLVTKALGIDAERGARDPRISDAARRPVSAVLGRLVRHGGGRSDPQRAGRAWRKPEASRAAAGADGQRQRRARQRIGYTGPSAPRLPGRPRRHGQGVRVAKITISRRGALWRN